MKKLILFGLVLATHSFAMPDEPASPQPPSGDACAEMIAPLNRPVPMTAAEFRTWPERDRKHLLEGTTHLLVTSIATIAEIKIEFEKLDPKIEASHLAAAQKLVGLFESQTSMDVSNDLGDDRPTVTIGSVQFSVYLYVHSDGTILGGRVIARQSGGDYIDLTPNADWSVKHFSTKQDATTAGVDVGADVSWTGNATYEFNEEGQIHTLTPSEGYLEWTGY